jgi:hypothetical protein
MTQEEQESDEWTWDILPGHVIAGCQAPEGPKRHSRGGAKRAPGRLQKPMSPGGAKEGGRAGVLQTRLSV